MNIQELTLCLEHFQTGKIATPAGLELGQLVSWLTNQICPEDVPVAVEMLRSITELHRAGEVEASPSIRPIDSATDQRLAFGLYFSVLGRAMEMRYPQENSNSIPFKINGLG